MSTATTARDFRSQVLHGYWLRVIITHESYAGHHIEHRLKEAGPAGERDQSEQTSHGQHPAELMAEGAAELSLDIVLGPGRGA